MPTQDPNAGIEKVPRFLRPWEKKRMEQRAKEFATAANSPYLTDAGHKAQLVAAHDRCVRDIESQTAPSLSKSEEDACAKRRDQLQEYIQDGMPTSEDMRRNPVGAVDHHMRWERRNKKNIKEWKALQIALHPGMDASACQDLCNIETLRTRTDPSKNYDDAQIPRTQIFSMPPTVLGEKAGWPYILDSTPEGALYQERMARESAERELEELKQKLASAPPTGGKNSIAPKQGQKPWAKN